MVIGFLLLIIQCLADIIPESCVDLELLRTSIQVYPESLQDMMRGCEVVFQLQSGPASARHMGTDIITHGREITLIKMAFQFSLGAGSEDNWLRYAFFDSKIIEAALIHRQVCLRQKILLL